MTTTPTEAASRAAARHGLTLTDEAARDIADAALGAYDTVVTATNPVAAEVWAVIDEDGKEHMKRDLVRRIDHMVPLKEAWESGAFAWSADKRKQFANDLTAPQLWAVTAHSNRSKGSKDPAEWQPPLLSFGCEYATAWVQVKARYALTADQAEHDALAAMLSRC